MSMPSPYLTYEAFEAAVSRRILIQLSNDESNATSVKADIVEQALAIASERIDSALRSRYALPLTFVPTLLEQHCFCLARHWLYARRPEGKMPETVKDTYQQAVRELEQIALGRLHLGIAEVPSTGEAVGSLAPDENKFVVRNPARLNTEGY